MDPIIVFALFVLVAALAVALARVFGRPRGADGDITAAVNLALSREFPLPGAHIDVKTFGGAVILGGTVREFEQAKRAVEIARAVPGVTTVESRLTVRQG